MIRNLFLVLGPLVVFWLLIQDGIAWRNELAKIRYEWGEPYTQRFWWYSYADWDPHWIRYLIPEIGGDEWGRNTLVVHVPFCGFLVWAYRTCYCDDCVETREQTENLMER